MENISIEYNSFSLIISTLTGTHFAVSVGVLERLDEAQRLVDRSSDGQVVHGDLAHDAVAVDDEQAAQRVTQVLQVDAVVLGYLMRGVRKERDVDSAEAALLARCVYPRQVRELAVGRDGEHLRLERTELGHSVAERDYLGRADEREIERVEEQN